MVQKNTIVETLEERLVLPDKSATSSVLNGVSNGMMLTGLPLFMAETCLPLFGKDPTKHIPNNLRIAGIAAIAVGAVVGGIYGKKEGDEINKYRQTLRAEITHLHKRIDERHMPSERWTDVVKSDGSEISR